MKTITLVECISWVLPILGIIVTIIIAFIQAKVKKKKSTTKIQTEAKTFIQNNSDERDYIHWATVAAGCFVQEKHARKIYNEFSVLPRKVKLEVLHQLGVDIDLINNDLWIDKKMDLIVQSIKDLGLGTDFLYDNAKYFHRAYNHKDRLLSKYELGYDFPDIFKLRNIKVFARENLTFEQYMDDFIYCKYETPMKMSDNIIPPVDALLRIYKLKSVHTSEELVTFWIMQLVENVIPHAINRLGYVSKKHLQTDAHAVTFEDKYFSILYNLYYLNK